MNDLQKKIITIFADDNNLLNRKPTFQQLETDTST